MGCIWSHCSVILFGDNIILTIFIHIIKRPARDACLCMGDLQAPAPPASPHFVFLITL